MTHVWKIYGDELLSYLPRRNESRTDRMECIYIHYTLLNENNNNIIDLFCTYYACTYAE